MSVEAAIDLLNELGAHPHCSITQLSARIGLSPSAIHRMLATLKDKDMVVQDLQSRQYSLGPGVLRLGDSFLRQSDFRRIAPPFMKLLRDELNETVGLCVRVGTQRVYVEQIESEQSIKQVIKLGSPYPLYCSAPGKILMAHMLAKDVERLIADTELAKVGPNTITNADQLKAELVKVRHQGYAVSQAEHTIGSSSVAAPIFDVRENAVAALVAFGPYPRFDPGNDGEAIQAIVKTAYEISCKLGYHHLAARDLTGEPSSTGTVSNSSCSAMVLTNISS